MHLIVAHKRQPGQKTACVSRYGAWGDAVLITPVFRALKKDGYHVTFNCTERSLDVLAFNPNIDVFLIQDTNEFPPEKLEEYWANLKPQFDKYINLSGSIESGLLKSPKQPEYNWPKEERHKICNVNYMDRTMELSGYPDLKGELPELHFKRSENQFAKKLRKKHKGFLVIVSLSGSSVHKIYPWMGDVVSAITRAIPKSHIILVGEAGCRGIIDESPQITDLSGSINIRETFCLLKYADLVLSTESAVANAASAFDTPKVVILSHSSEENLTKYWKNCQAVYQPVSCYPCHKLHYSKETCTLDEELKLPICAALLSPKKVLDAVSKVYENYLVRKNTK